MYQLKTIPEDFLVDELPSKKFSDKGRYTIFLLKKRNYTTEDAIQTICDKLHLERKYVGYSGIKDKKAITTQYISFLNINPEKIKNLELKDIHLDFIGYSDEPLSLGELEGNKFTLIVRNLEKDFDTKKIKELKQKEFIINYFDEQRFSKNNVELGRYIIKKKYKEACELILKEDSQFSELIKKHFSKTQTSKNEYLNALKKIPKKILMIYIHAFQSYIWNETVKEYLTKNKQTETYLSINEQTKELEVPLVGFSTETHTNQQIQNIIDELMKKEELTLRDFILRDFPEISIEGTTRKIYAEIKELKIYEAEKDELNENKLKLLLEFILDKGSYATMVVKQLVE